MAEGLSQDDFRKLLQTPRPATSNRETSEFKAPAPKPPRNTGSVFATPQSVKRKRPKVEKNTAVKSQYRDRAAERRNNEQNPEESTEQLLLNTRREQDEEMDAQHLYEQSKYLGGDVDHTHLVKGLDFALLNRVRQELSEKKAALEDVKMDLDAEEALDDALESIDKNKWVQPAAADVTEKEAPMFHSAMAKSVYDLVHAKPAERQELFAPGRMAFVFELADEVGHYSDAFAIPTAIIRSKADVANRLAQSGWSEDMKAESEVVISKIADIMHGRLQKANKPDPPPPMLPPTSEQPPTTVVPDTSFSIFDDVDSDYTLDVEALERRRQERAQSSSRVDYFKDTSLQEESDTTKDVAMVDAGTEEHVSELLSKANKDTTAVEQTQEPVLATPTLRRFGDSAPRDLDANDIDMYGLGASELPTSFEERRQAMGYDSDEEKSHLTSLIDQGTHRNKKAQLTRWDFDDEEAWQKYKDSVEIHPKSAFQFGVKLGDGRKRNREQRKGLNEKQKLNREYQKIKSIMEKKYGK